MSNVIYNNLKKGYKINVGQEIGDRVRSFTFTDGWKQWDAEAIDNILDNVMNNFFILQELELNEYSQQDYDELKELLKGKIVTAFNKFANQNATPAQIYYYFELCTEVGETPEQLYDNQSVGSEIQRLKELAEQQEDECGVEVVESAFGDDIVCEVLV